MAKLYGVDYNEAKSLSFQYLYGHIPDDVLNSNPFFAKVQLYIDEVWKRYKSKNFIESDIYNKKIYRNNLSDMNKNKVFNYLIQLMETESNMRMLTELLPKIKSLGRRGPDTAKAVRRKRRIPSSRSCCQNVGSGGGAVLGKREKEDGSQMLSIFCKASSPQFFRRWHLCCRRRWNLNSCKYDTKKMRNEKVTIEGNGMNV